MSVAFEDILKTTGTQGQRKGLEAYADRIVTLDEFKIEHKGRLVDKEGNPKEQRRVLTARVSTNGLKPRRARIPKRYAERFMEAMGLRTDESEPLVIRDVLVKVGEGGAHLAAPERPKNGHDTEQPRRPGRPRRAAQAPAPEGEPAAV